MIRGILAALALLAVPAAAQAPQPNISPAEYLAQHICLDATARPIPGMIPHINPLCSSVAPARMGVPLTYVTYDWRRGQRGPKRSDSVLTAGPRVVQTFDFGGEQGWRWGWYDRGQDGGDLATWDGGQVWYSMTEDGGGGRQWFRFEGCPDDARGWLLWMGEPRREWSLANYRHGIARSPDGCPPDYSAVQTRWRLQPVTLLWSDGETGGEIVVDAMLTLHFAGGPPEQSWGGEFFVHARHLGRVAWGAFFSHERDANAQQRWVDRWWAIHTDQRCPGMEAQIMGLIPGNHTLSDCRLYTQFRAEAALPMEWPR